MFRSTYLQRLPAAREGAGPLPACAPTRNGQVAEALLASLGRVELIEAVAWRAMELRQTLRLKLSPQALEFITKGFHAWHWVAQMNRAMAGWTQDC